MVIEGIGLGRAGSTSPELLCIHMYVPYVYAYARLRARVRAGLLVCVCVCVRARVCVCARVRVRASCCTIVCVCVRVVRAVVCARSCLMSTCDSTWQYINICFCLLAAALARSCVRGREADAEQLTPRGRS